MTDPSNRRSGDHGGGASNADPPSLAAVLDAVARRARIAARLEPPAGEAVLRSIVEAAAGLFEAEAASIAIHDPARELLVFRHAAGAAGEGAIGIEIASSAGIAGYAFTSGQPLVVGDVASDPRFDRRAAEASGHVPRQILAVPLVDDHGSVGVLEVIDRRDGRSFDLRDVELAGVFARQAAVAIRASRVERDVAELLRRTLARLADDPSAPLDDSITAALATLADDDDQLWPLVDAIARVRRADPRQLALVGDILDALARQVEEQAARDGRRAGRAARRGPGTGR